MKKRNAADTTGNLVVVRQVKIGDLHISKTEELRAVLGSTVAICIYDPTTGIGGMNHYLLAHSPKPDVLDMQYGEWALPALIVRCLRAGANRNNLTAQIYGGGIDSNSASRSFLAKANVNYAVEEMELRGIRITNRDAGGPYAREVSFCTKTGQTTIKRLPLPESTDDKISKSTGALPIAA